MSPAADAEGNAGLDVTPGEILGVCGRFEAAGNDLLTALTRTRAQLADLGTPWGGDEEGEAFAKNYLPAAEKVFDVVGLLAGALSGIGRTLALNAGQLASYEQATTARLSTPAPPSAVANVSSTSGAVSRVPLGSGSG